jgi:hypothetical protein
MMCMSWLEDFEKIEEAINIAKVRISADDFLRCRVGTRDLVYQNGK